MTNFKYVVKKHTFGEKKDMPEGRHEVTIAWTAVRESKFEVEDETMRAAGIKPLEISILLKNDLDETIFDTIYQRVDSETFTFVFQEWKMDLYSHAVGIPEGQIFNDIQDWLDYIKDKRIIIEVENNQNGRPKVRKIESFEEELAF